MTITLTLPPDMERQLVELAAKHGQDVQTYACELIRRGVTRAPTFDEILQPFRQQVAASGLSDEALTNLFESARDEVQATSGNARL